MQNFHGVFSLTLIGIAAAVGLTATFKASIWIAVLYIAILAASGILIVYLYCGKCTCRHHACRHVLPGKLVRFLPERAPGAYSYSDFIGTAIGLAALFGFPQPWLWQRPFLFILFWTLSVIAMAEILVFVCNGCENDGCPVNHLRNPGSNAPESDQRRQ